MQAYYPIAGVDPLNKVYPAGHSLWFETHISLGLLVNLLLLFVKLLMSFKRDTSVFADEVVKSTDFNFYASLISFYSSTQTGDFSLIPF